MDESDNVRGVSRGRVAPVAGGRGPLTRSLGYGSGATGALDAIADGTLSDNHLRNQEGVAYTKRFLDYSGTGVSPAFVYPSDVPEPP